MWQAKFIEMSMKLQSTADGGLFRHLSNVNEMLQIMLSSWLVNIFIILFPIFTIAAIFLLIQTIRGWRYIICPRLRYAIPVLLVVFLACSSVVFVQLSEINDDINKIHSSSDYYIDRFRYQVALSINSTKMSLMTTLNVKKYDLFPILDKILTDIVLLANGTTTNKNFSIDLFGKSDTMIGLFESANLYANSSYDMRKSITNLQKSCNIGLLESRFFCSIYKPECDAFFAELRSMETFFTARNAVNSRFITIFGTVLPGLKNVLQLFNVTEYLMSPVEFYDNGLRRMDALLDQLIHDRVDRIISETIADNRATITKYLQLTEKYAKFALYSTVALCIVFLVCVTISVVLNSVISATVKYNCPIFWGVAHFLTFFFGSLMLVVFVTGTSVVLNSQTEVCRYLADVSDSSIIADGFIDSFMDHQSRFFLAKNVPQKILQIPRLNIKNPRGILTTVMRQCPARRILLPSLKLYRPINTTAIIYSDFLLQNVLLPNIGRANHTIYDNYGKISNVAQKLFDAKTTLLDLLQFFPRDSEHRFFSFDRLTEAVETIDSQRNKFFLDGVSERLDIDKPVFDKCFEFLANVTVFRDNEAFLYELIGPMKYFETLIRELVGIVGNVHSTIGVERQKYFSRLLEALVEPGRFYVDRLVGVLEEAALSRIIPCFEQSDFYLETIRGVCTNQLGNVLVLMVFGTLTFTVGNVLLLVIMMAF